jgi:hypothetical protein
MNFPFGPIQRSIDIERVVMKVVNPDSVEKTRRKKGIFQLSCAGSQASREYGR